MPRIRSVSGNDIKSTIGGLELPINPWRGASYVASNGSAANLGTVESPTTMAGIISRGSKATNNKVRFRNGQTIKAADLTFPAIGFQSVTGYDGGDGSTILPIIDGSIAISNGAWTPYTTQPTTPNMCPNPNLTTFSSDARGNHGPVGWHFFSAGSSFFSQETVKVRSPLVNAIKMLVSGGSSEIDFTSTQSLPASDPTVLTFYIANDNGTDQVSLQIQELTSNKYLQSDGVTWAATVYSKTLSPTSSYTQYTQTFQVPAAAPVNILFNRLTTPATIYIEGPVTLTLATPLPTSPNTYTTTIGTSTPGIICQGVDNWKSVGTDQDRLSNNSFIMVGTTLYIRDDLGSPTGYSYANVDQVLVLPTGCDDVTISNLSFRMSKRQAIALNSNRIKISNIVLDVCGDDRQPTNGNGTIGLSINSDCVLDGITIKNCSTDGIYGFDSVRLVIKNFTITMTFGQASDGIQLDYSAFRTTAGCTIGPGTVDQRNSPSPKGCIINGGDISLITQIIGLAGQYCVNDNSSSSIVNACIGIGNLVYSFGTSAGTTSTNNIITNSVSVNSAIGLHATSGGHTAMQWKNCTVVGSGVGADMGSSGINGTITDCIFWLPTRTGPVININNTAGFSSVPLSHCIIGPELSGIPLITWNGVNYYTLAAFVAAGGNANFCYNSDPVFVNYSAHDLHPTGHNALVGSSIGGLIGASSAVLSATQLAVLL